MQVGSKTKDGDAEKPGFFLKTWFLMLHFGATLSPPVFLTPQVLDLCKLTLTCKAYALVALRELAPHIICKPTHATASR